MVSIYSALTMHNFVLVIRETKIELAIDLFASPFIIKGHV